MEEIYNANLVEVEQQHKAFLTSALFFFSAIRLQSACNCTAQGACLMDRDHTDHVQQGLLPFHTPWNSPGRTRKGRGELGLQWI